MVTSGLLLFSSEAVKMYYSLAFRIKLILLILVGLNSVIFQRTTYRDVTTWNAASVPPFRARLAGCCRWFYGSGSSRLAAPSHTGLAMTSRAVMIKRRERDHPIEGRNPPVDELALFTHRPTEPVPPSLRFHTQSKGGWRALPTSPGSSQ